MSAVPPSIRGGAVAVLAALALAGCSGNNRSHAVGTGADLPDQEVSDFVLTETDGGRPQWTLYARYAATYEARGTVVSRDIRVDFFDETGARSSELTAREGELQKQTRDMTARGNVVLTTTEGTRMTTDEMHFRNAEQIITSDRLVRVERGRSVLEGTGFSSDPGLRHYEFKTRVNATIQANPEQLVPPRRKERP